jgi:hypothetical protein
MGRRKELRMQHMWKTVREYNVFRWAGALMWNSVSRYRGGLSAKMA